MEKRDRHQGHVTGLLRQWRETREHEKRARMRRERWEEIREAAQELHGDIAGASGSRPALYPNTGPHGSQYPPRPLPNLVEQAPTNDQIGNARGGRGVLLILAPMVAAVTAVVTLAGATPVVSGSWSPLIGVLGVLLLCGLVFLWRLQWRRGVAGSTRVVGIILGVVVLAAGLIGVHGQQVVDGKAIRRGSEISAALSMLDRMEESLRVLRENQGLLDLPDEQARPLMGVFAAAVAQAERIGQIWNPATAGDLVLPEMLEAHNQLNIAAARQQEALELRAATLANPEPGIAARADAAGREANAIIVNALPNTLSTCTRLLTEMVQGGQR